MEERNKIKMENNNSKITKQKKNSAMLLQHTYTHIYTLGSWFFHSHPVQTLKATSSWTQHFHPSTHTRTYTCDVHLFPKRKEEKESIHNVHTQQLCVWLYVCVILMCVNIRHLTSTSAETESSDSLVCIHMASIQFIETRWWIIQNTRKKGKVNTKSKRISISGGRNSASFSFSEQHSLPIAKRTCR